MHMVRGRSSCHSTCCTDALWVTYIHTDIFELHMYFV